MILEAEPDIEVVGEAADGVEAVAQVGEQPRPDVVLMDIRMPRLDGLAATEQLLRRPDPPRVVVLTTFDQNEYVVRALKRGRVRLPAEGRAAVAADRRGPGGGERRGADRAVDHPAADRALRRHGARRDRRRPCSTASPTASATSCASWRAGMSNAEIAAEMVIAETTVKTHVARILTKLGLRDRVQAVVLAYDCGFVTRRSV